MKFDEEDLLDNELVYMALALLQRTDEPLSSKEISSSTDYDRGYVTDFLRTLRKAGLIYEVNNERSPERAPNSRKYYYLKIESLTNFCLNLVEVLYAESEGSERFSGETFEEGDLSEKEIVPLVVKDYDFDPPVEKPDSERHQTDACNEFLRKYFAEYLGQNDGSTLTKMMIDDLYIGLVACKSEIDSEDLRELARKLRSIQGQREGIKEISDILKYE